MGSKRIGSIKKEKAKGGRSSKYTYVDLGKLERLGVSEYKPSEGDNFIAIIPPRSEEEFFAKEVHIHSNVGVDGLTFLCPKKMWNEACPICNGALQMRKEDPDDERIDELRTGVRYLFFVVDTASEKTEAKGVQWYNAPKTVKDEICNASTDKRTQETIDVSDPEEGANILFTRTGMMWNTRYSSFELERDRDPLKAEWLEDVPEFDDVLKVVDYDTIEREYMGIVEGASGSEPTSRGRKKRSEPEGDAESKPVEEERKSRGRKKRSEPEGDAESEPEPEQKESSKSDRSTSRIRDRVNQRRRGLGRQE